MAYKGVERRDEVRTGRRKRDVRTFSQKWRDFFRDYQSSVLFLFLALAMWVIIGLMVSLPFGTEMLLLFFFAFVKKYYNFDKMAFNFPYRVPKLAQALDASYPHVKMGEGITYWGNEKPSKEQIYSSDSDMRAHNLILGTTGSGKTELLLGLCANALTQNTGFIYVDGKGDPKLMEQIFRLARTFGREDDLLLINFITSGRDFIDKQTDKVTNNINLMDKASSGMLIELITGLMDDSGSSGDMWKGRAIAFVAALTRPLCYLRDKGFIQLSAETYLQYFELEALEKLINDPEKEFPNLDKAQFEVVALALISYITNIPGYNPKLYKDKKRQEQKTVEQHGYITMQLTRIFNDLTYNYAHIFKTDVGDIDFYDVVLNRRLLVTLLPALERAPDTLKMCGKLIVGNIKQMMSGCLGNRVEGQVREIIESRPTNAAVPFYIILDEYGYYAVVGFAVAPAQARSLGFSVTFAAQDFSSLKKSSAEEADATWENTNVRAVGRLTSGKESETWRRVCGAAGEAEVSNFSSLDRNAGVVGDTFRSPDSISISRMERLNYDDVAGQQDGEFTFIVGKKEDVNNGGVRVLRGMSFYTASEHPRDMRINDLIPVLLPQKDMVPSVKRVLHTVSKVMADHLLPSKLLSEQRCVPVAPLVKLSEQHEYFTAKGLPRQEQALASLWWLLEEQDKPKAFGISSQALVTEAARVDATGMERLHSFIDKLLDGVLNEAEVIQHAGSPEAASTVVTAQGETLSLPPDDSDDVCGDIVHIPPKSANAVDPMLIPQDKVIDRYLVFQEIELFRNPATYRVADDTAPTLEETVDDLLSRNQVRAVAMLTGSVNPNRMLRPIGETGEQQLELIKDTIREQTDTDHIQPLAATEMDKLRSVMFEAKELIKELEQQTRIKTENLNKN